MAVNYGFRVSKSSTENPSGAFYLLRHKMPNVLLPFNRLKRLSFADPQQAKVNGWAIQA
jgi:hypothetical protein